MSVDKQVAATTRVGMLVPTPAVLARTLLTCYAVTAALHLATISLATLLPLHVVALGGTKTQVGLLFSVMTVVSMVVRPTVGGWIDRYGARPVILPGAAVLVGTSLALHAAGTPTAVIALMAGLGLSSGLISTPASVLTAQASSPEHRGEALSTYYLASSVATAAAPPAAFALLQGGGMPFVFSIVTVLAVVIAMLAVSLPPSVRKTATGPTRRLRLWSRHALPASGVLILTTMGQSAVYAFVPLAVTASGKNGLLMWFFGLYSSWLIVCRALLRAISDRVGRARVLVPAMAAFALGLFLLVLPPARVSLLASALLLASGASVLYPTLLALVVDRAPEPERGLAMGDGVGGLGFRHRGRGGPARLHHRRLVIRNGLPRGRDGSKHRTGDLSRHGGPARRRPGRTSLLSQIVDVDEEIAEDFPQVGSCCGARGTPMADDAPGHTRLVTG